MSQSSANQHESLTSFQDAANDKLSSEHTGVRIMPGTAGCIMDPPAASEYAVLPVGVAMMSPSPCTIVTGLSFTSRLDINRAMFSKA